MEEKGIFQKNIYNFSESLYSMKGENLDNMQLKCNNINEVTYDELPVSECSIKCFQYFSQFFQQKVEDMYRILMGISRELANIKQIMSEEGEERTIESGPVFCLQHFLCSFYKI